MKSIPVTQHINWVGALNPELRRFDVVMHTEYGTSYNAYIVQGAQKTALVETVKDRFAAEQLARIESVAAPERIDYIVLDHTEPDHSGALAKLLELCPNATVVGSRAAITFLKDIANAEFPAKIVNGGDEIDLGGVTLRFISAPFLHWPDSIFTYVPQDKALISGDVFGCHYSTEKLLESAIDGEFLKAQRYYFDVIMGPFKKYVRDALERIAPLEIETICPSHGPVLDKAPHETIARYADWAADAPAGDAVFVGYVSCYGFTQQLGEEIVRALADNGVKAEMHDLGLEDTAALADMAVRSKGIVIGSPTLNRDVMPPVWSVLTVLSPLACAGKKAAAFGSYGWSGEAVGMIAARLEAIGCKVVFTHKTKLRPSAADLDAAYRFGADFAEAIK